MAELVSESKTTDGEYLLMDYLCNIYKQNVQTLKVIDASMPSVYKDCTKHYKNVEVECFFHTTEPNSQHQENIIEQLQPSKITKVQNEHTLQTDVQKLQVSNHVRVGALSQPCTSKETQITKYVKAEIPGKSKSFPALQITNQTETEKCMESEESSHSFACTSSQIQSEKYLKVGLSHQVNDAVQHSLSNTSKPPSYTQQTQKENCLNVRLTSRLNLSQNKTTSDKSANCTEIELSSQQDTSISQNNNLPSTTVNSILLSQVGMSQQQGTHTTQNDIIQNYKKILIPSQIKTSESQNNITRAEIAKNLRLEVAPQLSTSQSSNTILTNAAKYVKVEISPKTGEISLKTSIEQSKVLINEKSHLVEKLTPKIKTEPTTVLNSVKNGFLVRHLKLQKNSEQPVLLKNDVNTEFIKRIRLLQKLKDEKARIQKIENKVKRKMQLKVKNKIAKVTATNNKKIKLSMLRKLKELEKRDVLHWLMYWGLLSSHQICSKCERNMKLTKRCDLSNKYTWVCRDTKHHIKQSVCKGSIFQSRKIGLEDILILIHCWIHEMPQEWICLEFQHNIQTISDWSKLFREICTEVCAKDDSMIGGDGKVVEIEGKVFEKNKNEKLEFQWIFIGLEDVYTEKYFFRIVKKCSSQSFLQTVKSAVLPGTIIVSDFCSVYSDSLKEDLIASNEYHLYKFESPKGVSSKRKAWEAVLKQLPKTLKAGFNSHIGEYVWRKRNATAFDKMKKFISDIKMVYPPTIKD